MTRKNTPGPITLLDGGMGRELMRMGAPFRQPEWSALALIKTPELVQKAHEAFAAAGADILTTSNYAVVPAHIGEKRFGNEGAVLTARSGQLARAAASKFGCRVAGSIPPLFGSYRPDLFISEQAPNLLKVIIDALSPYIDLWLAETLSSTDEAAAVAEAVSSDKRPLWLSFTLLDGAEAQRKTPRIRSGESVVDAAAAAVASGASAVLFNCSRPEVMAAALTGTVEELKKLRSEISVGVYANAFPAQSEAAQANLELHEIRHDLDAQGYVDFVAEWCRRGATIIGGCCGIGPEHIATLRRKYK